MARACVSKVILVILSLFILLSAVITAKLCRDSLDPQKINDDYCDCEEDGSDEWLTSACSFVHVPPGSDAEKSSKFHCVNKGYLDTFIHTSKVNDGICDCCDGSDEPKGKCPDNCYEIGKGLRDELKAKIKAMKAGIQIKNTRAQQGKKEIEAKKLELKEKKALKEQKEKEEEAAEKEKIRLEKIEKMEKELLREKKMLAKTEQQKEQKDATQEHVTEANVAAAATDTATEQKDATQEHVTEANKEEQQKEESNKAETTEENQVEQKKEEEKAQTGEKENVAAVEEEVEVKSFKNEPLSYLWHYILHAYYSLIRPFYGEYSKTEAEKARDLVKSLQKEIEQLKTQITELENIVNTDFGTEYEYFPINNKCIESRQRQYTYELCLFNKVNQREGGGVTLLGKFTGWNEDRTAMKYENGIHCWQGPARSCLVKVQCGNDEEIVSVDEPSRCVYEMVLKTPSACNESLLQKLEEELKKLE
jgi:protein kinase C substrate 80K-H